MPPLSPVSISSLCSSSSLCRVLGFGSAVRDTDYNLLILFLGHKPMCKSGSAGPGPIGRTCTRAPSQTDGRQIERGDKHKGRNPHAVFTAAYIFLFAESSPSYGRRPMLGPSLFSVCSGRRKLASRIPSILSAHGCILNCTLRQLIIQVQ